MQINIQKISGSIMMIFLLTLIFLPAFTYSVQNQLAAGAASGLTYECNNDGKPGECKFEDLMAAVRNVVDKGTIIALSLSVVVIAFAGFKYMTSGGNSGERTKANQMLLKVVYGMGFIIAAWLIVSLILRGLGVVTPIAF